MKEIDKIEYVMQSKLFVILYWEYIIYVVYGLVIVLIEELNYSQIPSFLGPFWRSKLFVENEFFVFYFQ